jgi:soluble lytic murein transglycosylase-like protein
MATDWCRPLIRDVSTLHELDPLVIEAMVRVESSGRANAYRYEPAFWTRYLAGHATYKAMNPHRASASYGLMQVMYPTARAHGFRGEPEELFVPRTSLHYGCLVLKDCLAWSQGHLDSALAAYNGGKTRDNLAPPRRNGVYVNKVRAAMAQAKDNA